MFLTAQPDFSGVSRWRSKFDFCKLVLYYFNIGTYMSHKKYDEKGEQPQT